MDYKTIYEKVLSFRDERNWAQFHTPKDLALSISLEASELLEIFQWSGADTSAAGKEDKIREELADILIYCIYLADSIGADILDVIDKKIALNETRYPSNKAYGTSRKYTEL